MEVEEMNRFLQSVHKTRFIDYLTPQDGEAAEDALDRRLRWAARSRNVPDDAAEANFLLQHRDALREFLATAKAEIAEDEWLEFTEEEPSNVRVNVYSSSTARESIDFNNLMPTPRPPPVREPRPDATGVPLGARESTPTPTIQAQRALDAADAAGPQPGTARSPSPLLQRVRRNSPAPAVPRHPTRPGTPSPPLAHSRAATPSTAATPRPKPDRWSATPPGSRAFTTKTPGLEVRDQGPAYSPPQVRTPTPSPTVARNATPNSFDVRIKGDARFVQSRDRFGSSEVVYESDIRGGHTQTPSPHRTPSGMARRGEASGSDDILGSLRGSVRKGAGGAPVIRRKAPVKIPMSAILAGSLIIVTLISLVVLGVAYKFIDLPAWLGFDPVDQTAEVNPYETTAPATVAPIDPVAPATPVETTDETVETPPGVVIPTETTPTATPPAATTTPAPTATQSPATTTPATTTPATTTPATTAPATTDPTPAAKDPPEAATPTPEADPKTPEVPKDPVAADPSADPKDPVADPTPPATPAVAKPPLQGAWNGSVGSAACLADFTQKGESVKGVVTVAGVQYQVSGRYNPSQKSIYMRGTSDTSVVFKGSVNGRRVDGQARLGAGQLYQVWQLR